MLTKSSPVAAIPRTERVTFVESLKTSLTSCPTTGLDTLILRDGGSEQARSVSS